VTLHPQAVAALELWRQGPSVGAPGFDADGIAAVRADARAAAASEPKEPVHDVRDVDADGVRSRVYLPSAQERHGVLVFLHGGGFVFGDVDTHDAQSRRLANRTGLAVLAVDYRRPPEHRFPAAPDDVDTAVGWLRRAGDRHGLDPARVGVIGDSAGGNLALVAALRNPGRFRAAVLVYPFLEPATDRPSYDAPDGGLTRAEAQWYWRQYAGTTADLAHPDLAHPDLAPLRSTAQRLSALREPVLVQAAEHDVLVDEDHDLADRLGAAGVDVRLTTYPGMIHGFWRHPELFDASEEALAEAATFLRRHV
jgi:acetyl esterase